MKWLAGATLLLLAGVGALLLLGNSGSDGSDGSDGSASAATGPVRLAWKDSPRMIRVAELPNDRILTGRVRNTSLRPVDLSVDRIVIVDARGKRLASTARFLQAFAHGLYPPSMHVKGGKFERTRMGQIATVKPGQDLPLTLSWRLASSTAQPLEVRFGGGSLALPR
jgi:hypothetical protein